MRVVAALGLIAISSLTVASSLSAQAPSTANSAARAAFQRGEQLYVTEEYRAALPHLYRAYSLDSTFVVPLVFAALSHNNLQEYASTDSLVQEIETHRDRLDEHYLGWLAYLEGRILGDNEAALRAISRTAKMAPGTKAGYNVAWIAVGLNKPNEAREALESLDPSMEPMRGWFPYWNQLTRSYYMLGDYEKQLAAARKARESYPKSVAALWLEVEALAAMGRVGDVERLIEEGRSLDPTGGLNLGGVMTNTGVVLAAKGDQRVANRFFERALEWFDRQPRETKLSEAHRSWVAYTLYSAERWPEARRAYRRLVKDFSEDATYRGRLAVCSARNGDSEEAELLATWLEGDTGPYVFGATTFWRGHIAAALAQNADAVRLFREAVAEGLLLPRTFELDANLKELRTDPAFQEFLRPIG
jgi:tetratricopeptide (TPR) repeat protein